MKIITDIFHYLRNLDRKTFLVCLFVFTIVCLAVYVNNQLPAWAKKYYAMQFTFRMIADGDEFEQLVRQGTIKTIADEAWNGKPLINAKSLSSYLFRKHSFGTSVYGYGEFALLLHYSYLYANIKGDKEIKELVKQKFDKAFINSGGVKLLEMIRWLMVMWQ